MEQKRHMCTVDKRLCVVAANLPLHSLHPFTPSLQDIFSPHLSPLTPPPFFLELTEDIAAAFHDGMAIIEACEDHIAHRVHVAGNFSAL